MGGMLVCLVDCLVMGSDGWSVVDWVEKERDEGREGSIFK